jgi:hypothetical protein
LLRNQVAGGGVDAVAQDVSVRAVLEGDDVVEEAARPRDHPGPAGGIVRSRIRQVAHRIGAVQRVVERAPPRVGGVERVPGVRRRDHQLRPGDLGDLRVDARGVDLERLASRLDVPDRLQERAVRGGVVRRALPFAVPVVDQPLQTVADGEQLAVARTQRRDDVAEARPELVGAHPRAGQHLVVDEVVEDALDAESARVDVIPVFLVGHQASLGTCERVSASERAATTGLRGRGTQ